MNTTSFLKVLNKNELQSIKGNGVTNSLKDLDVFRVMMSGHGIGNGTGQAR